MWEMVCSHDYKYSCKGKPVAANAVIKIEPVELSDNQTKMRLCASDGRDIVPQNSLSVKVSGSSSLGSFAGLVLGTASNVEGIEEVRYLTERCR